jgi:hypothetical protein
MYPLTSMLLIALVVGDPASDATMTLRCTNPFSGTTWDVAIDHARRTADSFPASITDKTIEWHDLARGGYYEFDRTSGELTVVYASSTGGNSLRDNCRFVEKSDAAPSADKKLLSTD